MTGEAKTLKFGEGINLKLRRSNSNLRSNQFYIKIRFFSLVSFETCIVKRVKDHTMVCHLADNHPRNIVTDFQSLSFPV